MTVMEGVRYGMEQGLYGWEVTDCEICLTMEFITVQLVTPQIFVPLLLSC